MSAAPSPERRFWRYRIFVATWIAYAGFYLCRKNFSVVMPMLEHDLGFSKLQLANLIAGFNVISAPTFSWALPVRSACLRFYPA